MSFAKNLRTERRKLDLSTQELAKKAGISRSYVTLLENDKRPPTKTTVTKIAKGLGVKSWLIEKWFIEEQLKKSV